MKKSIYWIVAIVIVVIIALLGSQSSRQTGESGTFTVGAVLPLTGPAALWGETVKNGMELAAKKYPSVKIIYEDSKSTAADGVSAYNNLQSKGVDLTVSETSLVSVPLAKLASERKKPLLVTLVATEHSKIVNDYTTRYYTDPTNYALPAFTDPISPVLASKKIAVLHRNDELGVAVKDKIVELAATNKKTLSLVESFVPNEKDYRTALTKIKNSGAEVLIFVVANPVEAVGIVKTASELSIGIPMIESSAVFADLDTRKQAGDVRFYSTSYAFSKEGNAKDFKEEYARTFSKAPNFGSAFGYDIVKLIDACAGEPAFQECLIGVKESTGVAGTAKQVLKGDFVVSMHLEQVN